MNQAGNMALRAPQDWVATASQAGAAIARSFTARPVAAPQRARRSLHAQNPEGHGMTREESDQVEALIMEWYHWSRGYRPQLGVGKVSAFARGMDALMQGRTVFVIAHRLSTVQNSDVIMVLEHGRIIERGSHAHLIEQQGKYYQLYTGAFELE